MKKRHIIPIAVAFSIVGGVVFFPQLSHFFSPPPVPIVKANLESGVFFPETFTLKNGMQVVVITNRRAPLVTHMVWYKVGSADDPIGKSGLAHVLEHLMFKGTKTIPPGEFSRIIARHGGKDNAFTSWDYTAYHQIVAKEHLSLVMQMEAERMTGLILSDEVVKPEIEVVREERRQRTENQPNSRLQNDVLSALYVHHPYGMPIIGWDDEIKALSRQDAEVFYRAWYAPNNAILVISGDTSAEEVRPLAEKYYGVISQRDTPNRFHVSEPPLETEKRVVLKDPLVSQPSVQRTYRAPSFVTSSSNEAPYALQILSHILGDGPTSRLYRRLVVEDKVAVAAGASYSPYDRDGSTFTIYAVPAPPHTVETVERSMLLEIEHFLREGPTEAEAANAKTYLQREAIFARDSAVGPAYIVGMALAIGQSIDDIEAWPHRIGSVQTKDILTAAHDVLDSKGHVTGILLPETRKKPSPNKGS